MKTMTMRIAAATILACASLTGSGAAAQGGGVSMPLGRLHELLFVQLTPGSRESFLTFLRDEYVPLQRLDPNIKSLSYYVEDKGNEWDLVIDMAYDDYAGAGASQKRFADDLAKRYPAPADRAAFMTKFHSAVARHEHLFYRDLPALSAGR